MKRIGCTLHPAAPKLPFISTLSTTYSSPQVHRTATAAGTQICEPGNQTSRTYDHANHPAEFKSLPIDNGAAAAIPSDAATVVGLSIYRTKTLIPLSTFSSRWQPNPPRGLFSGAACGKVEYRSNNAGKSGASSGPRGRSGRLTILGVTRSRPTLGRSIWSNAPESSSPHISTDSGCCAVDSCFLPYAEPFMRFQQQTAAANLWQ